jgi:hypothetical protein
MEALLLEQLATLQQIEAGLHDLEALGFEGLAELQSDVAQKIAACLEALKACENPN